jgi:hypothetical protein
MRTDALIKVELHVPPQHEEEFHAWYELEHIPQVLAMNGFVSGRRYYCNEAFPKFLALYETVDVAVEQSPSWKSLGTHPTPWSRRMATFFGQLGPTRKRQNFEKQVDTRSGGTHPGAVFVIDSADCAASPDQIKAVAQAAGSIPGCTGYRFLKVPGGARALEIFDFATEASAHSQAWEAFMKSDARAGLQKTLQDSTQHLYIATGTPVLRENWG